MVVEGTRNQQESGGVWFTALHGHSLPAPFVFNPFSDTPRSFSHFIHQWVFFVCVCVCVYSDSFVSPHLTFTQLLLCGAQQHKSQQ